MYVCTPYFFWSKFEQLVKTNAQLLATDEKLKCERGEIHSNSGLEYANPAETLKRFYQNNQT